MQAIKPAFCHMVNPCSDANQAIIRTWMRLLLQRPNVGLTRIERG
jgi:hypothetical protein